MSWKCALEKWSGFICKLRSEISEYRVSFTEGKKKEEKSRFLTACQVGRRPFWTVGI